jgi:hypothetical protein
MLFLVPVLAHYRYIEGSMAQALPSDFELIRCMLHLHPGLIAASAPGSSLNIWQLSGIGTYKAPS